LLERKDLGKHREGCEFETVECPCPGCEVKVLRNEVEAHMDASLGEHVRAMMKKVSQQGREIVKLRAQDSEKDGRIAYWQKPGDGKIIRKVFTWSLESWDLGECARSESLQFCDGVSAWCSLDPSSGTDDFTHEFSLYFHQLEMRVGVHATFNVLDTEDAAILAEDRDPRRGWPHPECQPMCVGFCSAFSPGKNFKASCKSGDMSIMPTDAEKAQALREDGSIKLRAVVDVHLL
jgi:hypothetical protein